ncbi:MAG: low molecular weight phosphatase family protein, partial [Microbacterium sp.]
MTRRELRRLRTAATPAPTILTVCTGNICRSALASVLLQARLGSVRVLSAGTQALEGEGMPPEQQSIARGRGARAEDIAAHRAQQLVEPLVAESELVLAMTQEHRRYAMRLVPGQLHRIFTAREFARLAAQLSDAEVQRIADGAGADARDRLGAVVLAISARRGAGEPDEDVIDPYR